MAGARVGGTAALYREREERFTRTAAAALALRNRLSRGRLVVFLIGSATIGIALTEAGTTGAAGWIASAALAVAFVLLVVRQRRAESERAANVDLSRINAEAGARVTRSWSRLPAADPPGPEPAPPLARDLDLFGPGSIFQLLGSEATARGRGSLARWLIEPAAPAVVASRQAAVRELAGRLEFRQELQRQARGTPASGAPVDAFVQWAERDGWLRARGWHLRLARSLPILLAGLALAHGIGLLPPFWIAVIPLNAAVWLIGARGIGAELADVEVKADHLERYRELLRMMEQANFASAHLRGLQAVLRGDGPPAHRWIARLGRLVEMAEVRRSPMIYLPLQLATLWDTHLLHLLDGWRSAAGRRAGDWLDVLGELEALSALAGLAFDNPDWSYPVLDPVAETWRARGLGHPLLPAEGRVVNDLRLGPGGSFLLVTGSNMSGKSTLLRAIGTNIVLAQAGAPVCAEEFSLPPTRLGTSFVIEDSLQDGVSFFMAELQRLKVLIDEALAERTEPPGRYLFLLDEILKGTNSGERQIAVRRILRELLSRGAAGAISSHDLALADVPELRERSVAMHFREHFARRNGEMKMSFDYRLRDGVATTRNALALLELVGIGGGEPVP